MSEFMEAATAVDKVLTMLKDGGCKYPSVVIFDDGSGSLSVQASEKDKATLLLQQRGINLVGYITSSGKNDCYFELDIEELNKFKDLSCPHCGEDVSTLIRKGD